MMREEAIKMLKSKMDGHTDTSYEWAETVRMAIVALEQEPCEDCISRQAGLDAIARIGMRKCSTNEIEAVSECLRAVEALPPVTPAEKVWRCKDCKYFEYCSRWGDGRKTKEDGYCFLFEPKMQEVEE